MKRIDIYWFSGTGNSLLIANELKNYFEKKEIEVRLLAIENTDPKNIDLEATIGIITAVAMQGTYRVVWEFIKNLPEANGENVFFADTLQAYSGGLLGPVKKILENKGYNTLSAKEFKMPTNFRRDSKAGFEDKEIIDKAKLEIKEFCNQIISEKKNWRNNSVFSTFLSQLSKSVFLEKINRGIMRIKIDESKCIKCGVCVKLCPVKNLEGNGVPLSKDKCILCHRCVGFCPKNAIGFGAKRTIPYKAVETKFMLEKLDKSKNN